MDKKTQKLDLADSFQLVEDYFAPKIIGEVNDVFVKIARIKGDDIPWHKHDNEDELFYVVEGNLLFEIEGQESFNLSAGEMFVVPMGTRHRVSSEEECKIMLVEKKTTAHTGDVKTSITRSIDQQY